MPNYLKQGAYLDDPTGSGFTMPTAGGDVAARYGTMIWTGTVGTLFQMPQGATIIDFTTVVIEAFGGGTASARVGDGVTNNRWATSLDIGTAGQFRSGWVGSQTLAAGSLTADTYVIMTLNAPGTATAGTVGAIAYYMMR